MPSSPGGASEKTDDGETNNNTLDHLGGSGDNSQFKNREKGLFSRSTDGKCDHSLYMLLSDSQNPKQYIQSLVQLLLMWMKTDINPSDPIELNDLTTSLMKVLCIGFFEFLYSVESANESNCQQRPYDEDEFIAKFCEGDVFAFIENLRDYNSEKSKKLLIYLQNQKLNELRMEDSNSANRFLKLRSEIVHGFRVFEYGTLFYYVSELKNLKKAFDYTIWYFRNSSLCMDPNFRDILMAIVDTLIMLNFNSVLDAAKEVEPGIWDSDYVKLDDGENVLDQYFTLKKNQSIACVKRLIIANKATRYVITPTILETILKRLQDDFDCIEDIIDIYQANTDKFSTDDSEVILKLKTTISNKWKSSWESNISGSVLDHHTSLPTQLNTAIPGGASSQSTTNLVNSNVVRFSEWIGIFPECEIFDTLKKFEKVSSDVNATEVMRDGWMKEVASDPIQVLNSMQRAIEGLYCNLQSSRKDALESVISKEEIYKENIKISRMRRQNENSGTSQSSTTVNSSQTFVSPSLLLRTQPSLTTSQLLTNTSTGRRTEHPTPSSQDSKRVKRD
ncbi:predicted protein [Naegleria gruberi]|uniref:Predicted protein n=1 Tax=Naegleria gruberi TaxID=5762 RepID=D2V2S0_NAEGR|nr:uncharacterized protein NAEGRDRAFT_63096 [Naegleria gruberi]EFC49109.1 predicted protein [Naegleria gruberi]|eukprot:XP_002681853.1 predicted protein [Naegleria gruberi strain NEG-M]